MSRGGKILIWILVIGGVVVLLPVVTHYRAKAAVARYRKQLQKQGEKLTIAQLTPRVSAEGENGGPALVRAAAMYGRWTTNSPPMMRIVAPGRVLVAWAEAVLPSEKSTNIWPGLEAEIRACHDALAGVRAALQYPVIQFDPDYSPGWATLLYHLAPMKGAEQLLSASAILELHNGQAADAWEDLRLCVAEVRLYHTEPVVISHLVQIAFGQIALATTWEALQYPGWSDGQLTELQKSWEAVDYWEGTESALSMSQVMMSQGFEEFRDSYTNYYTGARTVYSGAWGSSTPINNLGQVLANPKEGFSEFMDRYPGYWGWKYWVSYDEELYALQNLQASLDAVRQTRREGGFVPALEKLNKAREAIRRLHAARESHFVIARADAQMQTSFLTKIADAEMARRMLVTAIALKRFQLQHGQYPGQLSELTPQYLREAPIDFMDGKTLRYRTNNEGGFLLYSVGEDGEDNGGDLTPSGPAVSENRAPWWKWRDAGWPMPATAEEIKAYEDKIIAKVKQNHETELSRPAASSNAPPVASEPNNSNTTTKTN